MSNVHLTLAITHYDHVSDLTSGRVPVEGVDLTCLHLQAEEVFFRAIVYRDFDVSEVSMAKYASMRSQGDDSLIAIPVFPSRVPRHSSIYLRRSGPVKQPEDLAGRRVGVPEWAQTAPVYARGALAHQYGVDLASIEWIQGGVNEPGRPEKVALKLPHGLRVSRVADRSLNDMLLAGHLDAMISAHPPSSFENGHPDVGRLFEDFVAIERDYVCKTGIFPIMHTVAIRKPVLDRDPWVAMNLFKAFEEAKQRSIRRVLFSGVTHVPIPWCYEHARSERALFDGEYWPYGVDANRKTLDAFLQFAFEQGVCHKKMQPEDIFAHQVQQRFRV